MRYHLFQKVFGKMVKIKETSFLLSKCLVSIARHCNFQIVSSAFNGAGTVLVSKFGLVNIYLIRVLMELFKGAFP